MPKFQGKFDFSRHGPFKPMTSQQQNPKPNQHIFFLQKIVSAHFFFTKNCLLWLHLVRDKTWINTHEDIICHYIHIHIYIYAFSRRFYPKRLTVQSGYTFLFCLFTLWHQKVRTLCNLLQKCHYAAQAVSLQLLTRWTSVIKPPAQAPSWQPSCTGTSPGSRRWKFPVWCSELGLAVGHLHPRSLYRSPHVCYKNTNSCLIPS